MSDHHVLSTNCCKLSQIAQIIADIKIPQNTNICFYVLWIVCWLSHVGPKCVLRMHSSFWGIVVVVVDLWFVWNEGKRSTENWSLLYVKDVTLNTNWCCFGSWFALTKIYKETCEYGLSYRNCVYCNQTWDKKHDRRSVSCLYAIHLTILQRSFFGNWPWESGFSTVQKPHKTLNFYAHTLISQLLGECHCWWTSV